MVPPVSKLLAGQPITWVGLGDEALSRLQVEPEARSSAEGDPTGGTIPGGRRRPELAN